MQYFVGKTRDESCEIIVLVYPDNIPEHEAYKDAMKEFVGQEMNMILITDNLDEAMSIDCKEGMVVIMDGNQEHNAQQIRPALAVRTWLCLHTRTRRLSARH